MTPREAKAEREPAEELVPLADARALAALDEARHAIALARQQGDVDTLREWRDRADAIQHYAKRRDGAQQTANDAGEVKVRAERALGQLDRELAPAHRPEKSSQSEGFSAPLANLPSESRASWRKLGALEDDQFEELIAQARGNEDSGVTTSQLVRAVKDRERQDRTAAKRERTTALAALDVAPVLTAYPVLCADPPWRYESNTTPDTRAIENHYPTMSLAEIKALGVPASEDAVLFMWATSPKLAESLEVLEAWGFSYRTCMVWVKDRIGMGYYARQQHELLLIGKRGNLAVPDPSDRPASVFNAPRVEHSVKPQIAYDLIAAMYPDLPRVELFARSIREGWAAWGNEVEDVAA
jgi:N6-adenosine-specific RNA methylase IME4